MPKSTSVHLRKIKRSGPSGKPRFEWHLRWHGTDGKHYCKKLGNCDRMTKREAEAVRREFQVELDRGESPRDKPAEMTLEEFAEFHAEMIGEDRKPTTLYEYKLSARVAAEALGKHIAIQDIHATDVGVIRKGLTGSPATRAKHLSRLRSMFNHAKRWGLIHGDNPFANQPMPRFSPRSMRIFSNDEVEAMLAACPTMWWEAFILVGVTAGPRKEEILNLMWRDVDFEKRMLSITAKNRQRFTVSDGVAYETLAWTPKTYAIRTIPIPDRTVRRLQKLREKSDGSPYVFVSLERLGRVNAATASGTRRGRAETCNNILRDFRIIQTQAALSLGADSWESGTVHDLRRTYGTRMADVVPMHVLKQWMGHSDISVTEQFYLGKSDAHADAARKALIG